MTQAPPKDNTKVVGHHNRPLSDRTGQNDRSVAPEADIRGCVNSYLDSFHKIKAFIITIVCFRKTPT